MIECRADEYEELARQLYEAIAEGQSIEDTATMLRLLAAPPSEDAAPLDRCIVRAADNPWHCVTHDGAWRDFSKPRCEAAPASAAQSEETP